MCLSPTFVYIPSHSGITAIFSAAALQSKKGPRPKENITVCFFFFCRCCYSCKQKSRHPIIPVGERKRDRTLASQPRRPPSPPKKRNRIWQGYHLSKAWIVCESTPLPPLTVLHTRRCSVFPKLYPLPKLFSFFLELFLSFCPALLPPIRNSASQDPLRAGFLVCLICLSVCLVSFSPPTTLFTLSLDTDTNLSRNRPYCSGIPLRALLTKTKRNKKQREFTSIAVSDQTKKSRCICIIVHTIHKIHIYNYPFRCLLFS